jgi:hypothetical protein
MKELRTNYIKLSLTDKEFEVLQDLSENLDIPISATIRKLINYATVVGLLGEVYIESRKKYPNEIKLIEHVLTNSDKIEEYAEKQQILINFINDISSLAVFNLKWNLIGNENSFVPILDLIKHGKWDDPDFIEWVKKYQETNLEKK